MLAIAALVNGASPILGGATLSLEGKWAAWKSQYSHMLEGVEDSEAFAKFKATDERIAAHNAKGLSYTFGHNQFSAMTPEEFKDKVVGHANMKRKGPFNYAEDLANVAKLNFSSAAAASVDWVAKGAVTPVKDQGSCGSCWAFSATGSLEGAYFISTGQLKSFSEEQIVQCSSKSGNEGCNGGLMDDAFTWWETYPPVLESAYPYTSGSGLTGKCHGPKRDPAAAVGGFTDVSSETALLAAVTKTPVSVAIEADKSIFQSYTSGVITGKACGTNLDHGVLAVGYGTTAAGHTYWKVKNSWGKSWGMDGYVLLARDTDECGIADGPPSYPTGVTAPTEGK
jgi:C1A family cysteine protease